MDEIERKLSCLESKLEKITHHHEEQNKYEELNAQITILEALSRFYNSTSSLERIDKLKQALQAKATYSMYNPQVRSSRLDILNEKIDKILNTNRFMSQQVMGQGELIDRIESGFDISGDNVMQAYNELEAYRMYLERRNKYLRITVVLIAVLIVIICVRIFS